MICSLFLILISFLVTIFDGSLLLGHYVWFWLSLKWWTSCVKLFFALLIWNCQFIVHKRYLPENKCYLIKVNMPYNCMRDLFSKWFMWNEQLIVGCSITIYYCSCLLKGDIFLITCIAISQNIFKLQTYPFYILQFWLNLIKQLIDLTYIFFSVTVWDWGSCA